MRRKEDLSDAAALNEIRRVARRLTDAARVTVVTGAGVSAASGVPTFRDAGGLWSNFRVEDLATAAAFERDPNLVWEWYAWRRELVAKCRPNRAHEVLAAWSRKIPRFTLVTQNVDGLHERAGTRNVVRFHGSLWELQCWPRCGQPQWPDDRVPFPAMPPRCPRCKGLARPGVVWFGEAIPREAMEASLASLDCDVCVVAGTSSIVYPAAGLVDEAARRGAFTVEINPERTDASDRVDAVLQAPAEEVLDRLEGELGGGAPGSSGSRLSSSQ